MNPIDFESESTDLLRPKTLAIWCCTISLRLNVMQMTLAPFFRPQSCFLTAADINHPLTRGTLHPYLDSKFGLNPNKEGGRPCPPHLDSNLILNPSLNPNFDDRIALFGFESAWLIMLSYAHRKSWLGYWPSVNWGGPLHSLFSLVFSYGRPSISLRAP